MTTTETVTEETPRTSTKRQVTAVVASTSVTVVLSIVANVIIGKVATRVSNAINPPTENE